MPARTDDERDKALQEITELSGQLITEPQGTKLLEAFGLPLVRSKFVTSLGQALRAAKNIGYPVALKAISARIPHKTEAGAIRLNVRNESELQAAYDQVVSAAQRYEPPATIEGVLIQQMIESGTEFVMGFSHTEQFGPVIAFGLGGIYVEVLRDVAFRAAPLRRCDAQEMIAELKCKDILKGTRGKAQLDIDSILTCLLNLSDLAISSSEHLSELDLNPVFVFPKGQGLLAVDYLIKRHAVKK
jgi:acetyltransferase